MIDVSNVGHLAQLSIGILASLLFFVFAFAGKSRFLLLLVIAIIPFQPISSKFGSLNMLLVYMLGMAVLLSGGFPGATRRPMPLRIQYLALFLVFLISWAFSPRIFWSHNLYFLVMLGSNVVLFYLTYMACDQHSRIEQLVRVLLISNVLVLGYCLLQITVGFERFALFGIDEFALEVNRADQRLVGPFNAVGITAEYLVLQSLILGFYAVRQRKFSVWMSMILLGNAAVLVGTGNRGGLISAIIAALLFGFYFRRQLRAGGIVAFVLIMSVTITAASIVMIKFTDFNVLFERLVGTTFEAGYIPETRAGWIDVVDHIGERPVVGHGPRIVLPAELAPSQLRAWPDGAIAYWPHNLYLYFLYTLGTLGLLAYFFWLVSYARILRAAKKHASREGPLNGFASLGLIILIVFSIDQLKVEFLRPSLLDYQHYLSVLFGMFCGYSKLVLQAKNKPAVGGA